MDRTGRTGSRTGEQLVGGRYRLLEPLGTGGMGTVWRAEDEVLGRSVAVKEVVFPPGLSADEQDTLRERTRREARAAARLDHPSAVTVYDVVEEDGRPWLVLELVEARTLAETVRDDGPLTPSRAAQVGLAVLGALEAAHARGIVHRDVKPSNVLLGVGGRVVLTDFGIATSTGDASITSTGLLLGSPSYISPERARGSAPGPASDLWALGATLFTAVEGRAPYDKGEALPTMTAVVTGDREPYRAAGPLVPVLDGLLEPDPDRRLDAGAARRQLEAVAAGEQRTQALPVAPRPAPDGGRRAERTAAFALPRPAEDPAQPVAGAARARTPEQAAPRLEPRPAPLPRRRRRPARALVAVAAVLALGGLGTLVALEGLPGPGLPGLSPGAPAEQESGGPEAAAEPPSDWVVHRGDLGWVAATPASYEPGDFNGSPQYKDPETRRTLRVEVLPGGGREDAVADREAAAADFSSRYPSYEEVEIRPVDYRGDSGADWEFTYSAGGADLHVLNRVFSIDGVGHSLWFQTHADDWDAAQEDMETVLETFRPARP